jgi:hypothetical protein
MKTPKNADIKYHDLMMPNGKRLGDCTCGDIETFKINDLLKILDNIGFWFALMPERDDEAVFIDNANV